ncbi:chemotaxis signal transduction protein [Azospirillum agricola]|uniref:chemotaxis protein CheW n=1 Tax=Azospirillum agricola TaxID=1720247 RepID=UPI001AE90651|nr:chemotaxis protein CheW [Azospirillum agricola]MBP2227584.1 chemotaxis signal transduction protein [Azospirillum agricola]
MGGFLGFDIAGLAFAVESDRVEEVAEAVRTTRLPFAPPHVEGLANVAGRILPVIDLTGRMRPATGTARSDGSEGGVLVVLRTGRGLLALRVGRVGGNLPEERVTRTAPAPEDAGLPVAARLVQDDRSLRLLDPDRLELGRGVALAGPAERQGSAGAAAAPPASAGGRATVRLLIVEAGGCAHALAMDEILLVSYVGEPRPLPDAPALVCGMVPVQNRPLLLTDPLGATPGAGGYAVVHATRCGPVGVRADAVRGMVRLPLGHEEKGGAGVASSIVDHEGGRLEVRTASRMLGEHLDGIGRLVPQGGDPAGHRLPRRFHRRFLTLLVDERVYALEFERVRRVVGASGRLRLPRGRGGETGGFDGLTEVDGAILPVVDLRLLLARRPIVNPPAGSGVAVLLEIGGGMVALIADAIQRIRRVAGDEVDPVADHMTAAVIRLDGALVPVLRPEGLVAGSAGPSRMTEDR